MILFEIQYFFIYNKLYNNFTVDNLFSSNIHMNQKKIIKTILFVLYMF